MQYKPGDIVLVHGTGLVDRIIQIGQHFRFSKEEAWYNHVALVVSEQGDLIEALSKGVQRSHISKYAVTEGETQIAALISVNRSDEDRLEMVNFAYSCLKDGYGWFDIFSSALCLLFGLKFQFGYDGTIICSGLVAKALEHGGKIIPRDADHCTPADIAKMFSI